MNIFETYGKENGTRCWFCDREYGIDKVLSISRHISKDKPIKKTREHIIPKSKIIYNIPKNYIGSCNECNLLKGKLDARGFAMWLHAMIESELYIWHEMGDYMKTMRNRAWKLYNKTSYLHKNYQTIRLQINHK
jgi:hypothetical protein